MTLRSILFAASLLTALVAGSAPVRADGISRVGYAIQAGSFTDLANAEKLTERLQGGGLDAYHFRNEGGFYAVRFGDFPNREAALEEARRLQTSQVIGDFFIAPPALGYPPGAPQPATPGGASAPATPPPGAARPPAPQEDLGPIAARTAERFVGIPYRWGGNNVAEGLDCSGFSRAVYYLVGVTIPRTADQQYRVGKPVVRAALRDGDLVFFGSEAKVTHVGIYVGGNRFVHAPRRGDVIRVSDLAEPDRARKYVGARRYF